MESRSLPYYASENTDGSDCRIGKPPVLQALFVALSVRNEWIRRTSGEGILYLCR